MATIGVLTVSDGRESVRQEIAEFAGGVEAEIARALAGQGHDVVRAEEIVSSNELAVSEARRLADRRPGLTVINIPVWAFPHFTMLAASELPGSLLLFSNVDPRYPGMVGMLAAAGALDQIGRVYGRAWGDVSDPDVVATLDRHARAGAAVQGLRGSTFGRIGGRPMGMYTAVANPDQWIDQFGVDVEEIDQWELVRRADQVSPTRAGSAREWLERHCAGVHYDGKRLTPELLERQIRTYHAMRSLIDEWNLDFCGIKGQPELTDHFCTMDVTEAFLNDPYDWEGAKRPTICSTEADMDGALTMQILHQISGTPVLFADVRCHHAELDVWDLCNSGQHATWFAARSASAADNLRHVHLHPEEFYFPAGGASVHHLAAAGEFTFARLTRLAGRYRMQVLRGSLERFGEAMDEKLMRSSTYVWPHAFARFDAPAEEILGRYGSNHIHAIPGDHVESLRFFCRLLDVDYEGFGSGDVSEQLLLGIDIGTASSKGLLVDADGGLVRRAIREHSISVPRPGWVEHDAEQVWWEGVRTLCRDLLGPGDAERVAAVGISGIGPCGVPCDADDRPLRPAILYGVDTRAAEEAGEMTRRLGTKTIIARGGSALSSQALGPKLLWLSRHEPEIWAATSRWHSAGSFVVARLTGEWVLDRHTASQCDPFYDLGAEDWAHDWAAELLPDLALPRLAWPREVVGAVGAVAAADTGLRAGTPVVAGTVDAWAEAVGVGARGPDDLMVMYGSTMFVRGATSPATDPRIWTTAGTEPGSLTHAAGLATSGSLTAWLREISGGVPFAELVAEADAVEPGAEGLLVLPYFAGERTPLFDPDARGTITGLTLRHTRGHLYRAALEGIACAARHGLEGLIGGASVRAVAVGGGLRGRLWPQLVSDLTGLEQEVTVEADGAAYGDALLAAEGVGLAPPGSSWAQTAEVIAPRPELRSHYDRQYGLYRELHEATMVIQHKLARGAP